MQCPECGSAVAESAAMCPACGAQLSGAMNANTMRADGSRGFFAHHFELTLLVGGIAVVVIAALSILHYNPHSAEMVAGQAIDHSNPFVTVLLLAIATVIIASVVSAQRGRLPFIRRIAGLDAIDEAVGRATEMGRPMLFSPGISGLGMVTLQALSVASHVGRKAVKYGTRLIIPVCDSTVMPISEQMMREAYTAEGHAESFRPEDIRFLSDRQFAYAAGVTGILHRERVAASFLFGQFYAEALILAENGQAVGAIQVAGTPDLTQIPFFVVTCDYTIIGDEFYAATAYISHEPTLLGSLVGQDLGKALLFSLVLVGMALAIFHPESPVLQWLGGGLAR